MAVGTKVLMFVVAVALAGLGVFLVTVGLDDADKWSSVFGGFATLVGLLLSLYGVWLTRRQQAEPPAGQTITNSTIGGGVTQVRGVRGDVRIGSAPVVPRPRSFSRPSFSPAPATGPAKSGGQSVTGTGTSGPVAQYDDIDGDLDIQR